MNEKDRLQRIRNKTTVEVLLQNKGFIDIILKKYMEDSIRELMYREGSSDGVCRGIDARKELNDFIFNIIEEGKYEEEK